MQLATFFSGKFHIDSKDHILLDCLLSAPVSQLKNIMESHGRFLPEEPGDSEDGTEDLESSNASNGGETVGNGSEAVGDDGVDMNNEDGSDAEQRNSASGSTTGQNSPLLTPTSSQSPPSLRELIPPHQEMLERTIERAANFPISESVVVRPSPTHHNAAGNPFQVSLPIRTAGYHHTGQSSSAHQQTPETPPQRRHRHTSSSSAFARTSYQPISPPQSANRRSPGVNPRDAPVTDLRHREIGFLGEAFVRLRIACLRVRVFELTIFVDSPSVHSLHHRLGLSKLDQSTAGGGRTPSLHRKGEGLCRLYLRRPLRAYAIYAP